MLVDPLVALLLAFAFVGVLLMSNRRRQRQRRGWVSLEESGMTITLTKSVTYAYGQIDPVERISSGPAEKDSRDALQGTDTLAHPDGCRYALVSIVPR